MADATDNEFMRQAVEASKNAPARTNCFRVGAVLVDNNRQFISSGYTLEFGEGCHAEAAAIKKAHKSKMSVKGATLYSSLEPCSIRKSGNKDCCALLKEEGIAQVFFAMSEPPIFVNCTGENKLKEGGIKVEKIEDFKDAVKEINKHLFGSA